ncbi:hypothetical protein Tco_0281109 [Tanacetum coccineum]
MGETLVLNRSLDPFFEDYKELNNLNVPLEHRRIKVDDLDATLRKDLAEKKSMMLVKYLQSGNLEVLES